MVMVPSRVFSIEREFLYGTDNVFQFNHSVMTFYEILYFAIIGDG